MKNQKFELIEHFKGSSKAGKKLIAMSKYEGKIKKLKVEMEKNNGLCEYYIKTITICSRCNQSINERSEKYINSMKNLEDRVLNQHNSLLKSEEEFLNGTICCKCIPKRSL
ncbi:hypothetical protein HOC11_02985 [archaeon]|nr:hypothetical protein [archaeon]